MFRQSPTRSLAHRFSAAAVVIATHNHLQTQLLRHLLSKQLLPRLLNKHLRHHRLPALVHLCMGNAEELAGPVRPPVLLALAKQPMSGIANACHKLETRVLGAKEFSS